MYWTFTTNSLLIQSYSTLPNSFQVISDSSVDLDGFVRVMTNYYKKDFAKIDDSGTISLEEFFDRMDSEMDEAMNFSHDIKKELIKEVFSLIDTDGDCTLSFEEFVKFTQKFSIWKHLAKIGIMISNSTHLISPIRTFFSVKRHDKYTVNTARNVSVFEWVFWREVTTHGPN